MKQGLHPRYVETDIVCGTCGTTYKTRSTRKGPIKVELCAHCHPFYTGEQRIVDTAGQVDRFMRRMQLQKETAAKAKKLVAAAATTSAEDEE
ncbi:MAG: 50S ribosomal protein L31 [Chloroflexi bacterium]|nr:50S ribosomal protein L31 [Chloroflexota bacterium]